MHSHVLPIPPCTCTAVSHTVRAARAQYAFATRPAAHASAAPRLSTAHDAYSATLDEPSIRQRASARRCCTAWNEPTGTPYCCRSRRVGDRDVEHAAHDADEIGAREREAERGPRREVVAREQPRLAVDGMHRRARPGSTRTARVRSAPPSAARPSTDTLREPVAGTVGRDQDERRAGRFGGASTA